MKNLKSILIFPVLLAAGMLSAPLYAQQKADDTTCARQVSASTLGEPAEPATPEADKYWDGKFYIKTNLPAWIMLWSNAAIEADIAPHWTGGFSLYYSGLNYFTGHIKFRTFTVMPEIRYFFRPDNTGWFCSARAGMAYYNVAFNGDHRYQDHRGRTPAFGGGVSGGFRWHLRNPRWLMEAYVGVGVYHLNYEVWENYHNGPKVDQRHRTFFGIDNLGLSIIYSFSEKRNKKGGAK